MINLEYSVAGQLISATSVPQYLVADTVGIYRVVFTFDSDWSDLGEKTAVFRNPSVIDVELRDVPVEFPLDENNSALIPGAILDPGKLFIGVYGVNGTQQMPTIWAPPMQVVPGASPGVDAPDDPAIGTAVRTAPQTLTEAEKAQARENIGAIGGVEGDEGNVVVIGSNQNIVDSGVSLSDILPSKSASGRLIKIYDGAKGLPLKSAILHINPRKRNSVMYPYDRGMFNVRQHMLLANEDLRDQIKYYMPNSTIDETNKTITFGPAYTHYSDHGAFDAVQWNDGLDTATFVITCHKSSGTNTAMPVRLFYHGVSSNSNMGNLVTPVTNKQTIYSSKSTTDINSWAKTNTGNANLVVYYDESYIADIAITASDPKPEYVGERIVRLYPVDVYAGEFNLLTGELAVCPTIESYNGETLTGRWFSSLDDYAPGTTPTNGAFVVDLDGEKTTYQLDPVNLHTLQGYNRIWADYYYMAEYTNTLDIEYYVDPMIFTNEAQDEVRRTIAPIENGETASQPFVVGAFLYRFGTLYKVTNDISSGGTFTVGTNITATTVAEQLMALA